jgi:hypothetical protein
MPTSSAQSRGDNNNGSEMDILHEIIDGIRQHGQRQDGTSAQLTDLAHFARKLGLTDGLSLIGRLEPELGDDSQLSPYLQPALDGLKEGAGSQIGKDDQGIALKALANRLGLYDAADVLRTSLVKRKRISP